MSKKKIPSSILSRGWQLAKLSSRLIKDELEIQVKSRLTGDTTVSEESRLKQTAEFVRSLENLKGAALKIGQLISIEYSDILPPEVVGVLRKLQHNVSYMPFDEVQAILRRRLGAERCEQMESLSPEPIAAASIGQVHTAIIQGQKVAIKIQYPGIQKSLKTDVWIVKKFFMALCRMSGKDFDFEAIFDEVLKTLRREVNYDLERKNLERYSEHFASYGDFVIPKPLEGFCTPTVLTMSFEEGKTFTELLQSGYFVRMGPEKINGLASKLLDLIISEFFCFGLVQTDPNFGNFLYHEDKIVLLDLGAAKSFSLAFRKNVAKLVALLNADASPQEIIEYSVAIGIVHPEENQNFMDEYVKLMNLIKCLVSSDAKAFAFDDQEYLRMVRETSWNLARHCKKSVAYNFIFLNRKLGGIFHLLKELKATVAMAPHTQKVLDFLG